MKLPMSRHDRNDASISLAFLLAGFGVWLLIPSQVHKGFVKGLFPELLPKLGCLIMIFTAGWSLVVKLAKQLRAAKEGKAAEAGCVSRTPGAVNGARLLPALGTMILYAVIMEYVGYLVATIVSLFAFLLVIGERNWRTLVMLPPVSAVLIWYVFQVIMQMQLPTWNL